MNDIRYILDTDIGSDIDDAYALSLLLRQNVALAGITTVYGNAFQRAKIASKFLELYGRTDIKVYVGENYPGKQPLKKFEKTEDGQLQIMDYRHNEMSDCAVSAGAVDFILNTIRGNPLRVIILAIGPLTNLAAAIKKDRSTFLQTKEIVMMGGNFNEVKAEWNIECDPEAAKIVFESGVPVKTVGIELTKNCIFTKEIADFFLNLKDKKDALLADMTREWIERYNCYPKMHDPLALSPLFDPEIIDYKNESVRVETEGKLRAVTLVEDNGNSRGQIEYAVTADYDRFFKFLLQSFKAKTKT